MWSLTTTPEWIVAKPVLLPLNTRSFAFPELPVPGMLMPERLCELSDLEHISVKSFK